MVDFIDALRDYDEVPGQDSLPVFEKGTQVWCFSEEKVLTGIVLECEAALPNGLLPWSVAFTRSKSRGKSFCHIRYFRQGPLLEQFFLSPEEMAKSVMEDAARSVLCFTLTNNDQENESESGSST